MKIKTLENQSNRLAVKILSTHNADYTHAHKTSYKAKDIFVNNVITL